MILEAEKFVPTVDQVLSAIFVTVGVSSECPAAHGGAAGKRRNVSAAANESVSIPAAKRKKSARRLIQSRKASSGGMTKCRYETSISRWSHQCIDPVQNHFCSSTVGTCPANSHLSISS